jgi:hypothetical protein
VTGMYNEEPPGCKPKTKTAITADGMVVSRSVWDWLFVCGQGQHPIGCSAIRGARDYLYHRLSAGVEDDGKAGR